MKPLKKTEGTWVFNEQVRTFNKRGEAYTYVIQKRVEDGAIRYVRYFPNGKSRITYKSWW